MPSLAELTDYYPQQDGSDTLPVESVVPDADGVRRVLISKPAPAPDGSPDGGYFTEPMAEVVGSNGFLDEPFSAGTKIGNKLFGTGGEERYQTWPEKVIREALAAAHDVATGQTPDYEIDPSTYDVHTSPQMIQSAQAMSALAGTGGLAGADASLGSSPFLRPALKYEGKIYKAGKTLSEGGEHSDAIPAHLDELFRQQAMSGEDISNFNFGFMNHKGQFLDREKALDYGINEGLIDPSAGKFGALTSTMMADSSKPGTAIEAMAKTYPLAKPSDRWTNTLGQNDHLIKNMSPDEFLAKGKPLKIDAESRENIDALKQHIKEGKPLDPLEIYPEKGNQTNDGRHRAIAAKELGIKEVPVIDHRPIEPTQPFYSALEHNVNAIQQGKMTGDQWLGTLSNKPGVKPEELDWTGVKSFLEEKGKQPVTKAELQEHLQNNKVEIKDINKGGYEPTIKELDKSSKEWHNKKYNDLDDATKKEIYEEIKGLKDKPTKYHSYQLPGGENYREKLLTLPKKDNVFDQNLLYYLHKYPQVTAELKTSEDVAKAIKFNYAFGETAKGISPEEVLATAKYAMKNGPEDIGYKSSHWDEPNILAHVRMNDRMIDGKKALHIEEIQSDWHQQGRDRGYQNPKNQASEEEIMKLVKADSEARMAASAATEKAWKEASGGKAENLRQFTDTGIDRHELRRAQEYVNDSKERAAAYDKSIETARALKEAVDRGKTGLPDAPFKKTWHELALKRMIREAAEKGYDRLSWTPGEAQAARYDLSKQVSEIHYNPNTGYSKILDKNGRDISTGPIPKDKLADTIGKEAANKLLESKPNNLGIHSLTGQDLKIGGEGMKGFYDQIIPKALEKISGEKVKTANLNSKDEKLGKGSVTPRAIGGYRVEFPNGMAEVYSEKDVAERALASWKSSHNQPIHYIDIPQSLKDKAVSKGFPLFSSTHMFTPVAGDPFGNKK